MLRYFGDIGGILTYQLKRCNAAVGHQVGADVSSTYCVVILGSKEKAEKYAQDYLNKLYNNDDYTVDNVNFVPNENTPYFQIKNA